MFNTHSHPLAITVPELFTTLKTPTVLAANILLHPNRPLIKTRVAFVNTTRGVQLVPVTVNHRPAAPKKVQPQDFPRDEYRPR